MYLILLNAVSMFGQEFMARNNPVMICIARQIPTSDPKFHHPLWKVLVGLLGHLLLF
jgi:hypothetical protein